MKQTINTENFTRQIQINGTVFNVHYFDRNINTYLTEQQVFYAVCKTLETCIEDWDKQPIDKKMSYILKACKRINLNVDLISLDGTIDKI